MPEPSIFVTSVRQRAWCPARRQTKHCRCWYFASESPWSARATQAIPCLNSNRQQFFSLTQLNPLDTTNRIGFL